MAKQQYHHGNLRETLISSGRDIIQSQGYEALTLKSVAQRAAVSGTALYRHFDNKEALLATLAANGFDELRAELEATREQGLGSLARARALADVYADFAITKPHLFDLMFLREILSGGFAAVDAAAATCFHVLIEAFQDCQADGEFREGNIVEMAYATFAGAHGSITLLANRRPPPFLAGMELRRALDLVWNTTLGNILKR